MQARYCSEKCQEEDWVNHKDYCRRRQKKRKQKRKEKSKKKKSEDDNEEEEVGGDGDREEDGAFVRCNDEGEEEEGEERCSDKMKALNLN